MLAGMHILLGLPLHQQPTHFLLRPPWIWSPSRFPCHFVSAHCCATPPQPNPQPPCLLAWYSCGFTNGHMHMDSQPHPDTLNPDLLYHHTLPISHAVNAPVFLPKLPSPPLVVPPVTPACCCRSCCMRTAQPPAKLLLLLLLSFSALPCCHSSPCHHLQLQLLLLLLPEPLPSAPTPHTHHQQLGPIHPPRLNIQVPPSLLEVLRFQALCPFPFIAGLCSCVSTTTRSG